MKRQPRVGEWLIAAGSNTTCIVKGGRVKVCLDHIGARGAICSCGSFETLEYWLIRGFELEASDPLDLSKPLCLRNGGEVTVLDLNGPSDRPIRVRVPGGHVYHYPKSGHHYKDFEQPIDLVNVEASS